MRAVRGTRADRPARAPAPPVSVSPLATPRPTRVGQEGALAAAHASARPRLQRRDGRAAIALITEPARVGDGWRHLWLGDTGTGKTWAQRELVNLGGQLVIIHDDKGARAEYPHVRYFTTTADLLAAPAEEAAALSAAAFKGDPFSGVVCEVEEVAALALQLARVRIPVRLVVDEWDRAVSDGGRKLEAPALQACLTTGRALGLSVTGGAQTPQRCGDIVINSASSIGIFRLGQRAVNYLEERLLFDREMTAVIPTLAVGDFVIHRPGRPWDRTIYRF